jgi:WD40 repeat protein
LNVVLSGDGRLAVSASRDKTLKVWDVESGRLIHTLEGHSGWNISVALSSDGQLAASAANDKTLNVWDLASGAEIAAFTCDAEARCCAVIDNKRFVAGDATGRLHWLELME